MPSPKEMRDQDGSKSFNFDLSATPELIIFHLGTRSEKAEQNNNLMNLTSHTTHIGLAAVSMPLLLEHLLATLSSQLPTTPIRCISRQS